MVSAAKTQFIMNKVVNISGTLYYFGGIFCEDITDNSDYNYICNHEAVMMYKLVDAAVKDAIGYSFSEVVGNVLKYGSNAVVSWHAYNIGANPILVVNTANIFNELSSGKSVSYAVSTTYSTNHVTEYAHLYSTADTLINFVPIAVLTCTNPGLAWISMTLYGVQKTLENYEFTKTSEAFMIASSVVSYSIAPSGFLAKGLAVVSGFLNVVTNSFKKYEDNQHLVKYDNDKIKKLTADHSVVYDLTDNDCMPSKSLDNNQYENCINNILNSQYESSIQSCKDEIAIIQKNQSYYPTWTWFFEADEIPDCYDLIQLPTIDNNFQES
jgi:hypothetical protein